MEHDFERGVGMWFHMTTGFIKRDFFSSITAGCVCFIYNFVPVSLPPCFGRHLSFTYSPHKNVVLNCHPSPNSNSRNAALSLTSCE
jgi:hypothetical protein